MIEDSQKSVHWFVRRVLEALLVLLIFMGGFLAREFWPAPRAPLRTDPCSYSPTPEVLEPPMPVAAAETAERPLPAEDPFAPVPAELVPVRRGLVPVTVVMTGRVQFNPQGLYSLSAPLPGRIDRVYHASPGLFVEAGEALIQLFCPETTEAQAALVDALRAQRETGDGGSGFFGKLKTRQIEEARDRLQRMGLTPSQIESVERSGAARDHLLFRAPVSGHLIELPVHNGQYVTRGDALGTVADLSTLHVVLAASQHDILWLRYGQTVQFIPEGREDMTWGGWIVSLAAAADPETQQWPVYVLALNSHDLLRPGMQVRASVACDAAGVGQVVDPNRADRWMCPDHPQVLSDHGGTCPQCRQALVSGSALGYLGLSSETEMPLYIPREALSYHRGQAQVTVQGPNEVWLERPLEGIGVVGDHVTVKQGLREGERVVIRKERPAGESL
jgi:Cu(I)/Ag(I) efflux system membrane fusion protein